MYVEEPRGNRRPTQKRNDGSVRFLRDAGVGSGNPFSREQPSIAFSTGSPSKVLRPRFFLYALYWCQYRVQFVRRDRDLDTIQAVVSFDLEHKRRVRDITRSARSDVSQHFLRSPINMARSRRIAQP